MRILFVIDSMKFGGAERVVARLANNLLGKHKITICQTLNNEISYFINPDIPIVSLSEMPFRFHIGLFVKDLLLSIKLTVIRRSINIYKTFRFIYALSSAALKLSDVIKDIRPDIILSFLINSNIVTLYTKKYLGNKSTVCCAIRNRIFEETNSLEWSYFYVKSIYDLYKYMDNYIAVTPEEIETISKELGFDRQRCYLIYNGVDMRELETLANKPLPTDLPEELYDKEAFKVVTLGRLEKAKNQEMIIQAMSLIGASEKNIHLFIIGNGSQKEYLKKLARRNKVDKNIHFLGWRKNPFNIMRICDIFILSSKWEGFPNALLEAMSIGLPVISTPASEAVIHLLKGGEVGVLVNNNIEMAKAILDLCINRRLLNYFSQMSRERARDFNIQYMIEAYDKMFKNIKRSIDGR